MYKGDFVFFYFFLPRKLCHQPNRKSLCHEVTCRKLHPRICFHSWRWFWPFFHLVSPTNRIRSWSSRSISHAKFPYGCLQLLVEDGRLKIDSCFSYIYLPLLIEDWVSKHDLSDRWFKINIIIFRRSITYWRLNQECFSRMLCPISNKALHISFMRTRSI